jgi:hypothetical protein
MIKVPDATGPVEEEFRTGILTTEDGWQTPDAATRGKREGIHGCSACIREKSYKPLYE